MACARCADKILTLRDLSEAYREIKNLEEQKKIEDRRRKDELIQERVKTIEGVRRILHDTSSRHGGRDIGLPCFEDVRKPDEWCHRQLIADRLNEHGLEVRELGVPAQLTLF